MQHFDSLLTIIDIGKENGCLQDLIKQKVQAEAHDGFIPEDFKWFKEANVIHLAAMFHQKSLAHFLKLEPNLRVCFLLFKTKVIIIHNI